MARKVPIQQQASIQQVSSQPSNAYSNDTTNTDSAAVPKKKRGRPRKETQQIFDGNNNPELTTKLSKKKIKSKRELDDYNDRSIDELCSDKVNFIYI